MGSVAAQRQVTISKLGPCSPGLLGGGERAEGLLGSSINVLGDSGSDHLSPMLPGPAAPRSLSNTPLLGNLSLEAAPKLQDAGKGVGLSLRAQEF